MRKSPVRPSHRTEKSDGTEDYGASGDNRPRNGSDLRGGLGVITNGPVGGKSLEFTGSDGYCGVLTVADATYDRSSGMLDMKEGESPSPPNLTLDRTTLCPSIDDPLAHPLPTDACQSDPDLSLVTAVWPTLPEPIKAGIMAMVKAASGEGGGR
jgi:hypothetical protein